MPKGPMKKPTKKALVTIIQNLYQYLPKILKTDEDFAVEAGAEAAMAAYNVPTIERNGQ